MHLLWKIVFRITSSETIALILFNWRIEGRQTENMEISGEN